MKGPVTIRIALADDHGIVRKGISEIISTFGNFNVEIEASNGKELLTKIEATEDLPDICVLDVNMPGMNGYETLLKVKEKWPSIKVLVLTMFNNEYSIIKMLSGGANGYLLKNSDPKELKRALRHIYDYGYYFSEFVSARFFQALQKDNMLPNITDKEMEFLSLCCSELNYKEIASVMGLSVRTIEGYRNQLFEKLKLNTRIGLVMYALDIGIIPYKKQS